MSAPLVVLAAGGTGGHVFPAEALAAALGRDGYRLALITDKRGGAIGHGLARLEAHHIRAGGIAGKGLVHRAISTGELAIGLVQARRILSELRPAAVIGFGGYASVPTMLAASFAGLNTALHEQNAVLGRANRLLAPRVKRIATAFEATAEVPAAAAAKVVHVGMPVRARVAELRERAYQEPGADGPVSLLVIGGSQGAAVFGRVVPAALALLPGDARARIRLAQQCRPENIDAVRESCAQAGIDAELATFFEDAPERIASAHLLICRAGASTIAEVTTIGRPAILVPYPHAVDDHQRANAQAVDEAGGGWLMPEDAFTAASLAQRLGALIAEPWTLAGAARAARAAGRADAAERLAQVVRELAPTNGGTEGRREAA